MRMFSYRNYLVLLLMVIGACCYLDRVALSVVLQDIKGDLHLSDTQLGLLSGIAFAFFYSVMGIPLARWADRGNRVTIITLTATLWSVMVALSGMTSSFVQLLLVRMGIGVGEAGCVPPANSLIPDYFTRSERPRAVGIYMMGGFVSLVVGYFAAGWLNQFYGWRVMFVVLALPGLVLAALARLTLKEPRLDKLNRSAGGALCPPCAEGQSATSAEGRAGGGADTQPTLGEVLETLWANVTFRQLLMCFAVAYFFGYGIGQWLPTFFVRSYGFRTGELGTWFAMTHGLMGLVGSCAGGIVASRYAAHNERLQLRAMALGLSVLALVWMGIFLSHSPYVGFACLGIGVLGGAAVNGPIFVSD